MTGIPGVRHRYTLNVQTPEAHDRPLAFTFPDSGNQFRVMTLFSMSSTFGG